MGGDKMNYHRIAVDDKLDYIRRMLRDEGYGVVDLKPGMRLDNVDAVVVSGMDDNFAGMGDITTKAPVIEASGKDPKEILDAIRTRLV